jgi:phage terminase small subunit
MVYYKYEETKVNQLKLSKRQEQFCHEYLVDLNATKSAVRSGYTETTAKANCGRMLADPKVKARIDELKAGRIERVQIEADDVIERLLRIANKSEDEGDWHATIRATELLGRHLAMFTDKSKIQIENPFAAGQSDEDIRRDTEYLMRVAGIGLQQMRGD